MGLSGTIDSAVYSNRHHSGAGTHLPLYEANLSALTLRFLWEFARKQEADPSASLGVLLSTTLSAFDNFDNDSDTYGMCRAAAIEQFGDPAVLHWRGYQDWTSYTATNTDDTDRDNTDT